jgi:hypothetical protein
MGPDGRIGSGEVRARALGLDTRVDDDGAGMSEETLHDVRRSGQIVPIEDVNAESGIR